MVFSAAFQGLRVNQRRRQLWAVSAIAMALSVLGLLLSWLSPAIKAPLRPGLDFTGGTQIRMERRCGERCADLSVSAIQRKLAELNLPEQAGERPVNLAGSLVQSLDGGRQIVLRLPSLAPDQAQAVMDGVKPLVGDTNPEGLAVDTIGPTLGSQLLRASLISILVSFLGISAYITLRYDRTYALLALLCLGHDLLITCGVFAWLGLLAGVEVNSLFAVALLTIAGYSVNDTVVIFDRIREMRGNLKEQSLADQADAAVAATLSRSLFTSFTTLLPLIGLILFGGSTLFWLAVALSIGVIVGAWSSITIAPTLLPLLARR
jgi:preprotein translocase subunit SecF